MDYFWKENKVYVVAAGAGALGALLYWMFLVSPFRTEAASAARQRASEKAAYETLIAQGVPARNAPADAATDRDDSQKALAALVKDVAFKPADRFRKPDAEAKSHYEDLKLKVEKELKEKATKAKIEFQGGLGLGDDNRDDLLPELLLRLAVVDRVVSAAIEAGVEKIEAVDGLYGANDSGAANRKGAFLNAHAVFLKVRASSEAAFRILHGVQRKGAYLAVTQFAWAQDDPGRDLGAVSITVAVLKVDEKAPLEPKTEARP
jgi:hypothetical protein